MKRLYSTVPDVVESLEAAVDDHEEGTLVVISAHPAKVVAATEEEMDERNLSRDSQVCRIEFETATIGSGEAVSLMLKFHENQVNMPFELEPAGVPAVSPQQATSPLDLGTTLMEALQPLEQECGAIFTFAEVSAASVANGGHFTDFEFEYSIDGVNL